MTLAAYMFYFFELAAAVSAIGILLSKNVFKSALMLLCCLLSIAAIFVLAFAEFVAVAQILIYAGGVMIVVIFGIMLTSKISGKPLTVTNGNIFGGAIISGGLFALLANFIFAGLSLSPTQTIDTTSSIETIGIGLITTFSLPFEIAGILLLAALVGAAIASSTLNSKKT
jgi:NADH:ubiquinone oxidoreductase subunit 6 (subunit J)